VTEAPPRPGWFWPIALPTLICCGAIQALYQAPVLAWWLQLVGWVPVLLVLERLPPGRALLAGWLVGTTAFVVGVSWLAPTLRDFSGLGSASSVAALLALAVIGGFHVGVFAWGLAAVRRAAGPWRPVAVAAWFVACELLDPQLFPWYQGTAWIEVPRVFGVVSLAGVPAMTFGALLVNALLVELVHARRGSSDRRAIARGAAVLAGFVLVATGWSSWRLARYERLVEDAPTSHLGLVQPNRDRDAREALREEGRYAISRDLAALSTQAWMEHGPIDAFVWPEAALRGRPTLQRHRAARELVRHTRAELWTGACTRRPSDEGPVRYNSVFRLDADGTLDSLRYDKVILVPFGEYDPIGFVLPQLPRIDGTGTISPGDRLEVFETPAGSPAFLVCYEIIQREYARHARLRGADLLVTVTNDSWFGDSLGPRQHFGLSVARATELGLPLARVASTGITGAVDARGVVIDRTELFERQVLVVDLPRVRLPSVYAALGDWFGLLCVLLSALLLCLGAAEIQPGPRRRWFQLLPIWLGTMAAPAGWIGVPTVCWIHWLGWAAAMLSLLYVAGLWRRRDAATAPAPPCHSASTSGC